MVVSLGRGCGVAFCCFFFDLLVFGGHLGWDGLLRVRVAVGVTTGASKTGNVNGIFQCWEIEIGLWLSLSTLSEEESGRREGGCGCKQREAVWI
jgi:hypothetical protein